MDNRATNLNLLKKSLGIFEEQIRSDEHRVLLQIEKYGPWWTVIERSFLASCSSCWGYGCWRWPNVQTNDYDIEESQADILEEMPQKILVKGLAALKKHLKTLKTTLTLKNYRPC